MRLRKKQIQLLRELREDVLKNPMIPKKDRQKIAAKIAVIFPSIFLPNILSALSLNETEGGMMPW